MTFEIDSITAFSWICQAGILLVWIFISRHAASLRSLPDAISLMTRHRRKWPKLSIIIPALNEEKTIEPALTSILQTDYPDLEVIVINDRSTDATGAIIDKMASADPRIRALHIQQLPPGWLGKVHALEQGLQCSSGELILCTDADVHFATDALKRSVAVLERKSLDHLALLPQIQPAGIMFDVAMMQAAWLLFFFINPATIGTDRARLPMGVGAFNLVRGTFVRQLDPFKKLRLEVIDDIGLAILCHQAGGNGGLLFACDAVSLEYYSSYGAMLKGLEKNTFAFSQYSVIRSLIENLTIMITPVGAFLVPLVTGNTTTAATAVATLIICCFVQVSAMARHGVRLELTPFFPLGIFLTGVAGLRSMIQTARQGGIKWRGTFYEASQLKKMQVTKIPIPKRVSAKAQRSEN